MAKRKSTEVGRLNGFLACGVWSIKPFGTDPRVAHVKIDHNALVRHLISRARSHPDEIATALGGAITLVLKPLPDDPEARKDEV